MARLSVVKHYEVVNILNRIEKSHGHGKHKTTKI